MNCKKCGNPINPGDMFCMSCGERVEPLNNGGVAQQTTAQGVMQPAAPVGGQAPISSGPTLVEQPTSVSVVPSAPAQPVQSAPVMQPSAPMQQAQPVSQPATQPATPDVQSVSPTVAPSMTSAEPVSLAAPATSPAAPQSMVGATAVSMPVSTPKKSAGKFDINKDNMIYVIIIAVLAVAVIGLLAYIVFGGSDDKCAPSENKTNQNVAGDNNNDNNSDNNDNNQNGDNTGNVDNDQNNNANTILLGDYQFTVPTGFIYSIDADGMAAIGDTANTMAFTVSVENVRYSELYAKIEEVKMALNNQGFTVVDTKYQTLSGVSYIFIEVIYGELSMTYYFADINTNDVAAGVMMVQAGQLFDPVLNATVSLISSKKYLGTGNNNTSSFYVPLPNITPQDFANKLN